MKTHIGQALRPALVTILALAASAACQAVTVGANASTPTLIGSVEAGQTYTVTASGIADLFVGFNGLGLTFTADGLPTYAFAAPYAAFYPNGLYYDPSVGPSSIGPGGVGRLLGSLLGTFSATSPTPLNTFTIGLGTTFTASASGTLYGLVNDTFYGDNGSTGFTVSLISAVPEPGTYGLMVAGLALVSLSLRRRLTA